MNANLASIMPQAVARLVRGARPRRPLRLLHRLRGSDRRNCRTTSTSSSSAPSPRRRRPPTRSAIFTADAAPSPCSAARTRAAIRRTPRSYFDYVLGFTDQDDRRRRAAGLRAAPAARACSSRAKRQPRELPGVRERWKFIEPTLAKAPPLKIVPMIGSLGCPYTCSFCIDSTVPYQPLAFDRSRDDLRFLLAQDAAGRSSAGTIRTSASASTTTWTRSRRRCRRPASTSSPRAACRCCPSRICKRLQQQRLQGHAARHRILVRPGQQVEDRAQPPGMDKVQQVSEHVNMILRVHPVRADQLRPRPRLRRRAPSRSS